VVVVRMSVCMEVFGGCLYGGVRGKTTMAMVSVSVERDNEIGDEIIRVCFK
jgi:hypothetical protein